MRIVRPKKRAFPKLIPYSAVNKDSMLGKNICARIRLGIFTFMLLQ